MTSIDKIADIVRGHEVFIQGHDFPDADSVASAYGVKTLLEYKGIRSDIIYVGALEKLNILRMLDYLGIDATLDTDAKRLSEDDHIILVDAQKYNGNIKDCTGEEVVCIDHHLVTREPDFPFWDIRPDVGACSSIVASYFFEAGREPEKKTATALLYGIKMDTLDLKRGVSPLDVEMYSRLLLLADTDVLAGLQSNVMQFSELKAFGEAMQSIRVYHNIGIARLDTQCSDGLVAEISDFILNLNEVELCVVYAMRDGGVKLSVRSEVASINASESVTRALAGIGTGGGHAQMAGGFIPESNVSPHFDNDLRERFIKAFSQPV